MKQFLLLLTGLVVFSTLQAQYETIKNTIILQQFKKAKEDLDKGMTNAKFTSKPEAYILKADIYASLAASLRNVKIGMTRDEVIKLSGSPKNTSKTTTSGGTSEMLFYDDYTVNISEKGKVDWINQTGNNVGVKGTNELIQKIDNYMREAETAFDKYREMDPGMALLTDPVYQNAPINIYSGLFSSGYTDYENKNWKSGFEKFKKVVDLSDMLIAKKIIPVTADTNSLLLAGLTAENAGLKEDAAKYYTRMADLKARGQGFEGIYRFLVNYYYTKKDMANFEKYRALGKELYPNTEYFNYDKVDFAVGLEEEFNKKVKALEETIAADPSNQKAIILLGEIIYDTLDSRKDGAVQPANAAELETKMITAFNKSAELKTGDATPYIYIADHFINKSIKITEARDKHVADMKARTKPGTASSKEDVAKRDALDQEYGIAFNSAREPYEKAAEIISKKPAPLSGGDKQQYKKVAGYLADIATYNKNKSKGKPADLAKYTADEKKWNDVYDSIK